MSDQNNNRVLLLMESVKGKQEIKSFEIAPLDFISRLPDSVIHHILSFLRVRDVTSASTLSRTWNRICSTYPYVVFHFAYSDHPVQQEQLLDDLHIRMEKNDFLCFIEKSVRRRLEQEFSVRRFQLYIEFPDVELLSPNMDRWIGIAIRRSVTELALCIDCLTDPVRSYYSVPQGALLAGSLAVLSLSGCRFEGNLEVKLPHLQKLSLSDSCFGDEFIFDRILSGCPVIEYVKVSFCKQMDTLLSVSGLPLLKHFEFLYCGEVDSIEIDVSNLHTFSFASYVGNWPRSINLAACKLLKELRLSGASLTSFVPQLISELPALEILEMRNCTGSEGFRVSSQRLKKLVFRDCHHLANAKIDTPNLESFEYCNCDEPFIPISVSNALQIHLRIVLKGKAVDWLVKLKHFLKQLSYSEDLKIIIYRRSKGMIIHEKLSEVRFSSLCHFIQPDCICISSRSYTNLLSELFPLASPETIFVLHSSSKLMQLLLEKIEDLRNGPGLLCKLVGFEVDSSEDTNHLSDPATEVFIKAHSTVLFKTSAIILKWKHYVAGRRITL